jgi:hypothetical protein
MIFYDFRAGLNQEQCLERLQSAFSHDAPSRSTVFSWLAEFRRGRQSLEDEPRCGRPPTAVTPENIELVRQLVLEDRRISVHELEALVGIGSGSVKSILHDSLGLRKLESRWIPHTLTPEQMLIRVKWCKEMLVKFDEARSRRLYDVVTGDETWLYQYDPLNKRQSAEWVFPDDEPPTQTRRARSVGKQMVAYFFFPTDHVKTVLVKEHRRVTADWFVTICQPQVFNSVKDRRRKTGTRGLLLHQYNAPAHTAGTTEAFLREHHVTNLSQPPIQS